MSIASGAIFRFQGIDQPRHARAVRALDHYYIPRPDGREQTFLYVRLQSPPGSTPPLGARVVEMPPFRSRGKHQIDRSDVKGFGGIILRPMISIFGYAAKPIADRLQAKGGQLIAAPEGFIVMDREGPLKPGELDRAAAWAGRLAGAR